MPTIAAAQLSVALARRFRPCTILPWSFRLRLLLWRYSTKGRWTCPSSALAKAINRERSNSSFNPHVDLAAESYKIYRFSEKRFGAALQSLALSLGITVRSYHYDRNVGTRGLGLRQ